MNEPKPPQGSAPSAEQAVSGPEGGRGPGSAPRRRARWSWRALLLWSLLGLSPVLALGAYAGLRLAAPPKPEFNRQRIREIVLDQVYGFCPAAKDLKLADMKYIDPAKIPAGTFPEGLEWCRRGDLLYQGPGVYWAADMEGVEIEAVHYYQSPGSPKKNALVDLWITLYVLNEPLERGGPPRIESRRVKRRMMFQEDNVIQWKMWGIDMPLNPEMW